MWVGSTCPGLVLVFQPPVCECMPPEKIAPLPLGLHVNIGAFFGTPALWRVEVAPARVSAVGTAAQQTEGDNRLVVRRIEHILARIHADGNFPCLEFQLELDHVGEELDQLWAAIDVTMEVHPPENNIRSRAHTSINHTWPLSGSRTGPGDMNVGFFYARRWACFL